MANRGKTLIMLIFIWRSNAIDILLDGLIRFMAKQYHAVCEINVKSIAYWL